MGFNEIVFFFFFFLLHMQVPQQGCHQNRLNSSMEAMLSDPSGGDKADVENDPNSDMHIHSKHNVGSNTHSFHKARHDFGQKCGYPFPNPSCKFSFFCHHLHALQCCHL